MTITHCHQISNSTVSSATLDINVKDLLVLFFIEGFLDSVLSVGINVMLACSQSLEEIFDLVFVIFEQILDGVGIFDKLKHSILLTKGEDLVGSELEIKIDLFQQVVHELNDLQD